MNITRIVKNVFPAVIVMAAGLFGMNFVYNTYMKDGSTSVISLEPSAGEDATSAEVASEAAMEPMAGTSEPTAEETPVVSSESASTGTAEPDAPAPKTDCAATMATKVEGAADGNPALAVTDCTPSSTTASEAINVAPVPGTTETSPAPAPETAPAVYGTTEEIPAAD